MKIAILTLPLRTNYGGILQAWALQEVLFRHNHQPWIIRYEHRNLKKQNLVRKIIRFLYLRIYLNQINRKRLYSSSISKAIHKNTQKFITDRFKNLSPQILCKSDLIEYTIENNFDAYVVGSDQVWRPSYSPDLAAYFLDFCGKENVKKIAYAVSFGVNYWEFNSENSDMARKLVRNFDKVSVRENDGVVLCKEKLGVDAVHVLDPTLLLDQTDYTKLVNSATCEFEIPNGSLFAYILDKNTEKDSMIQECEIKCALKAFYCKSRLNPLISNNSKNPNDYIVPPVEQWIASFFNAKMIITDSFHGCVFSIIFNKPFWTFSNDKRGSSRINSLLDMFGLRDRIIVIGKPTDWNKIIDWDAVNVLQKKYREQSLNFLLSSLI